VLDNQGNSLYGAVVYLSQSPGGTALFTDSTDSSGSYYLANVPSGSYYLWAASRGKNSTQAFPYFIGAGRTHRPLI
jgi:hypothetical protein